MDPRSAARETAKIVPALGEFSFVTKAIAIEPPGDGGKRRFRMIASSTVVDEGKDEIKMSALEDLRAAYAAGRNVFTDHEHKVDNVFGRTDTAVIKDSGERDPKTGAPIFDLHIAGVVNEPDPRMVRLADSIDGGYVTFGASIGARVLEHKRNKAGGLDIYHLDGKEVSLVGIPMNQRSWTYKAAKAARALDAAEPEEDDEETEKALDTTEGDALIRQDLQGPKRKAAKCPTCGGDMDADGDCTDDYHTAKAAVIKSDPDGSDIVDEPAESTEEPAAPPAVEPETTTTKSESADGQESVEDASAETPETASGTEDAETDPAIEQKALAFEAADVVELAMKARDLATLLTQRDEEIAALKAENDRLTSEIEEAKQVIEKVMALPLRRKTAEVVKDLGERLPDFLAPGVKEFLTKNATGEPR